MPDDLFRIVTETWPDGTPKVPVTLCWHCDRPLDAATPPGLEDVMPTPGAVSLCLYCGAVAIFGFDLRLEPPTRELLDELQEDKEFMKTYMNFAWARQYVMIRENLMRDREDPDR